MVECDNVHPTIKAIKIMRYLCRLITPQNTLALVCGSCYNGNHDRTTEKKNVRGLQENILQSPQNSQTLLNGVCGDISNESPSSLSVLRNPIPSTELADGEGQNKEILFPPMRLECNEEDNQRGEVSRLSKNVSSEGGQQGDVLFTSMHDKANGIEQEEGGRNKKPSGLHFEKSARASDGDTGGVCYGASAGYGETPRKEFNSKRDSSSHKRKKGRQQGRKPDSASQVGARQAPKTKSKTNSMSSLRKNDKGFGACSKCGTALTKKKRGGIVLDMFMGSGSTGCAAVLEGLQFVGIEKEEPYVRIAEARIQHWGAKK